MKGAWLIHDLEVIRHDGLEATSFEKVSFKLSHGSFACDAAVGAQRLAGICKMYLANSEANVAPPPELNQITKGVLRLAQVAPERAVDKARPFRDRLQLLAKGDENGRVESND